MENNPEFGAQIGHQFFTHKAENKPAFELRAMPNGGWVVARLGRDAAAFSTSKEMMAWLSEELPGMEGE